MSRKRKTVAAPNDEQRRLIEYLKARPGLSVLKLATKAGISEGTIRRLLTHDNATMTNRTYQKLASVAPELAVGARKRRVQVVGYIGVGAVVHLFDGEAPHGVAESVEAPADLKETENPHALEIRGDAMLPLENGWLVFFQKMHEGVTADEINKLCIVKLRSGALMLKKLRRGYTAGRFNLESWAAPLVEDADVEWACAVRSITQT